MQETTTARPYSKLLGFHPTNEELIHHYLYRKVSGEPLPEDDIVKEYDLYGQKEPWEIWEMFGGASLEEDQELYFFTRLKKKSLKDSRINRKVGMGRWEAETSPKEVIVCGKPMGVWRLFSYKSSTPQNDRWMMHEYRLVHSLFQPTQSNDYVLCRIKNKKPASEKKRKMQEENLKKLRNLQESGREKKCKPIENHECIESKAEVVLLEIQESRQMDLTCTNNNEPAQSHASMEADLQQENGDGIAVGSTDADLMEPLFSNYELLNNFEGLDSEEKMSGTGNTGIKSTMEQPHYDVLLPLASLPPSTINAADGANEVAENWVNAKEQKSTMPQLTCTSSPSIVPQLPFTIDTTGLIETYAPVETYYGDEHYNDWAKSFAKELLKNQPPNAMEENEIIMFPNMYFKGTISLSPYNWQQIYL